MCFLDQKDMDDLNSGDDNDNDDFNQFAAEWYRRHDRDTLSIRRRAEHYSAGHYVSHKPSFYR